jgi:hypothetical protein
MRLLAEAAPVSFILTADRARAKPFYAGALGLPIVSEDDFAVTFALAGGARVRLTDLPNHEAGEQTVLGWNVPDISAAVNFRSGIPLNSFMKAGLPISRLMLATVLAGSTSIFDLACCPTTISPLSRT